MTSPTEPTEPTDAELFEEHRIARLENTMRVVLAYVERVDWRVEGAVGRSPHDRGVTDGIRAAAERISFDWFGVEPAELAEDVAREEGAATDVEAARRVNTPEGDVAAYQRARLAAADLGL